MTEATITPAQDARRIRWGWIAAGFLLLIVGLAASLLFAPPAFFFTSLLKSAVHDQTGRELTVAHSRYLIREIVTVELSGVELGRPGSAPGTSPFASRENHSALALALDSRPQAANLFRSNSTRPSSISCAPPAALETGSWRKRPSVRRTLAFALPPTTVSNGTLIYTDEGAATQLRLDAISASIAADPQYGGARRQRHIHLQ